MPLLDWLKTLFDPRGRAERDAAVVSTDAGEGEVDLENPFPEY
jgi:hypothetical protein